MSAADSFAVDWEKVRDINDVSVLPGYGFRDDPDTGARPDGTEWLGFVAHGSKIVDELGQRFTVVGYGSVQGSVVLRNRYRQMFQADIDMNVRVES